jgi:hypothetical protein
MIRRGSDTLKRRTHRGARSTKAPPDGRGAKQQKRSDATAIGALVRSLLEEHDNPAQLLELYYWSLEPDLLPVIRAIRAMQPEHRAVLASFLSMATDPRAITADVDGKGHVVLRSIHVESIVSRMRLAASESK